MATYSQSRHGYTLRLTITETATNVETNKSTITYSLQLISGNQYHFEQFGVGATVVIDGVTVASRNRNTDPYLTIGFNSTLTLLSGSTTVTHNTDGTKTITVGYTLNMADYYYTPGSISGSGSFVCATIPRATQPTVNVTSVNIGGSVTISVSGRASASFSHVLTYSIGSVTGSIATLNTSTTSYSWTVPNVANQITKAKSGTLTILCATKSGSTVIGTKSVTITVNVPNTSTYLPSISNLTVTEQNADISVLNLPAGEFVQNKSVITMACTASAKYGATIARKQFFVNATDVNPENYPLTTAGTYDAGCKVTDSRGYTADLNPAITVHPYSPPSVTAMSFYRCTSGGTADDSGEYLHYAFTGAISSIDGHNTNQWALHVQKAGTSTWTSVASGTGTTLSVSATSSTDVVDADYSYTVRLTLTDSFGQTVFTRTISTGFTTVDYKASGKGVAFGKAAETDNLLEYSASWKLKQAGDGELTLTRDTSQSYVDATSFARLNAQKRAGVLFLRGNMSVSNFGTNSTGVVIGTISGWSAAWVIDLTVPCQSGTGVLLVEVSTAGEIKIYNTSGATVNGFCRFMAAVPDA